MSSSDNQLYYFGYFIRNEDNGETHRGKLQVRASLQGTAIGLALEQVKQVFNGGSFVVYEGHRVTCQLTNLQTESCGWFNCTLKSRWTAETQRHEVQNNDE